MQQHFFGNSMPCLYRKPCLWAAYVKHCTVHRTPLKQQPVQHSVGSTRETKVFGDHISFSNSGIDYVDMIDWLCILLCYGLFTINTVTGHIKEKYNILQTDHRKILLSLNKRVGPYHIKYFKRCYRHLLTNKNHGNWRVLFCRYQCLVIKKIYRSRDIISKVSTITDHKV